MEYKEGALHMIDQRKLPHTFEIFVAKTCQEVDFAIRDMVVRGAPAIGAAAGYGAALAAKENQHEEKSVFLTRMTESLEKLNKSRPTAVNLMWAVKRMGKLIEMNTQLSVEDLADLILEEAHTIVREDQAINLAMGNAKIIKNHNFWGILEITS